MAVRQEGKSISYYVSFQPTNTVVQYGNTNGGLSHCEVGLKTPSGKTVTVPNESGIQVEGPGKYLVKSVTVYCNNGNTSTSFWAIPSEFTLSERSPSISLAIS